MRNLVGSKSVLSGARINGYCYITYTTNFRIKINLFEEFIANNLPIPSSYSNQVVPCIFTEHVKACFT